MAGDGGSADGGDTTPHLTGLVCILADLRDYRTCTAGSPGIMRITVEETREATMTDATGHFTMPLAMPGEVDARRAILAELKRS